MIFSAPKKIDFKKGEQEYLKSLFLSRGFAVTSLNNYLKCPWRYFYLNLLRIPTASSVPQLYGIAVHESLKNLFEALHRGEKTDKEYLLSQFETALKRVVRNVETYPSLLKRGKLALSGYYEQYSGRWNTNVMTEFSMHTELSSGLTLVGKLDKIEILDDGVEVHPHTKQVLRFAQ